jgi:hypothetical protein
VVTLVAPPATSVGAGSLLACALLEDGSRAVCAGSIDSFTGKDTSGPETVKLPEKAKRIVGGGSDLCFLGESGKLWCSGLSQSILARTGELAPGAWAAYSTPLSSATLHYHDVLAIGQDGSLLFAGAFDRGPRPTKPVQRSAVGVLGLTDVVELAAGEAHAGPRRGDGTVQCWGGSWEDSAIRLFADGYFSWACATLKRGSSPWMRHWALGAQGTVSDCPHRITSRPS